MNNSRFRIASFCLAASFFLSAFSAKAALVPLSGYTNDFSSQPPAADWSTRGIGSTGMAAAGEFQNAGALDTAAKTNSASLITAQPASAGGTPPNAANAAVWANAGGYLQTRATQIGAVLLMCTLVNNSGGDATGVRVIYDYVTNRAALTTGEEIRGHRVFYSLTGLANSWSNVLDLSQTGQGTLDVQITFSTPWTNDGRLYILWADDNGSGTPDDALNIDSFSAIPLGTAASVKLTAPASGQSFPNTNAVTLSANANAGPNATVTGVAFYETSSGFVGNDLLAPYSIAANFTAGTYQVYAASTNSLGVVVFSATNTFTVTDVPFSVALLTPPNNTVYPTPTNVVLSVTAHGGNGPTITGVAIHEATAGSIASFTAPPYTTTLYFGGGTFKLYAIATNSLGAVLASSTNTITINVPPTNSVPPTIYSQNPPHSTPVTNLTNITVTFSELVYGVDAADLLIDGVAATGVTGSGSNYIFTFPQPAYGQPVITWAANHGITDAGWPGPLPFDANGVGATWGYYLIDQTPPIIATRSPAAGSSVTNLSQISVTFREAVSGVDASDLLVNGAPADSVTGSGSNYTFNVAQPPSFGPLAIAVTWVTNHGIADLAATPNAFVGTNAGWNFTLDVRTVLVQSNSLWRFVKGTNEASAPTNAWRALNYDASAWSNAPAPFFFGDPYSNGIPAYTHLSDMQSNYSTVYFRSEFVVPAASLITNLLLNLQIDDGAVVWINGVNVLRLNAPAGEVAYNAVATGTTTEPQNNGAGYVSFTLTNGAAAALVDGTNVIAVHALNQSLTASSDFGFNAQLYTYVPDFSAVAPRLSTVNPPQGEVTSLTSLTITFSENVAGVDASDLLVNGVPAAGLSSENAATYTFTFAQPAPGPVTFTWAASPGIHDFDTPAKAFDGTATSAVLKFNVVNPNAPVLTTRTPAAGSSVTALTSVNVTFSAPVTGVDAADLLVNGSPATGLSGGGASYTFTFPQPAYGAVAITWASATGIQDGAANLFDGTRATNRWSFTLVDQTAPSILSVTPTAGTFVPSLTQLSVTFSEAVTGVNASDLLLNGIPATNVTGSGANYTFAFSAPNATSVNVSWAADHGITDVAVVPNAFIPVIWSYTTIDSVAPTVSVDPPPSAIVKNLTRIKVYFDEPVTGVNASDLLINGVPAQGVTGSGAGPYAFTFTRPATGDVQVAFAPAHGIRDLAASPNNFAGATWHYTLNPAIPTDIAVSHVVQMSLDGLAGVHLRFYVSNAPTQFPNFVRLMNEGAFTMNARCDYDISETVPNHTTMFTGRPVRQPDSSPNTTHHGYENNFPAAGDTIHANGNPNVPYKSSMFDVAHDYGLATAFFAGKTRLDICDRSYNSVNGALDLIGADNGRDKIDFSELVDRQGAAISNEVNGIVAELSSVTPRNYIFIHIAEPDQSGHSSSWGSAAYSNIVRTIDAQLGRILAAIDGNPELINQTALIITSDHGGGGVTPNAHTEAYHVNIYTIPFFLRAPGIAGGTDLYELFSNRADPGTNRTDYSTQPQPIRNGDGSNLALSLLALPPIPGSFMAPAFATPTTTLRVARYGNQFSVFWSDPNDEYILETADVINPLQWQTVTSGLTTNDTTKVYTIVDVNGAPKQFFRVRKP